MTGLAIGGAVGSLAGSGYSIFSGLRGGKAQQEAAEKQAAAAREQAELQAKESERAAAVADYQSGVAQISGEKDASRRSEQLAQDVGSTYAQAAGNGLMVDGSGKDTVGAVLSTQAANAAADITTIRDNTAMNVWNYQMQAAQHRRQAGYTRMAGANQSAALQTQGNLAMSGAVDSAIGTGIGMGGQLLSGIATVGQSVQKYGWTGWKPKSTAK